MGDYDQNKQKPGQTGTTDPTKTSQGGWNDRTQNERDQTYPQGSGQTGNPGQAGQTGQTGNTGMTGTPGQTGQTGNPGTIGSQPRPGMTPGDDKGEFEKQDIGSQRGSATDKEAQNQNR